MLYIFLYIFAVVAANTIVSVVGASATPYVSLALIGLDLTTRDYLHDLWRHKHLFRNMAILIACGSLLSFVISLLFNQSVLPFQVAARISIASFLAFLAAGTTDTLSYHSLYHKAPWIRVNGSNVLSAVVDSVLFIWIAFGSPLSIFIPMQITAKIVGGFLWFFIIQKVRQRRLATA